MYCPKCGTENPNNAIYCKGCGEPLQKKTDKHKKLIGKIIKRYDNSTHKWVWWIVGFVLFSMIINLINIIGAFIIVLSH